MMCTVSFARRPLPFLLLGGLVLVLVVGLVVWWAQREPEVERQRFPGASKPGDLVSVETWQGPHATAVDIWRIVYLTEDRHGEVREASALVSALADRPERALPVVAFAHGTTGVAESCAPSDRAQPVTTDGGALNAIAQQGAVLVAPDYAGLGTPGPHGFLVGEEAAYDVLNALRAVREMSEVEVSRKAVVWGQSQGGHAALWTGMLQPDYAPEVKLLGVAATAPPTDMVAMLEKVDDTGVLRRLRAYLLDSWRKVYPDSGLWDEVAPANRELVEKIGERCGNEGLGGLDAKLELPLLPSLEPGSAFRRLVEQNTPTGPIDVPVLIAQGDADQVVPVAGQRAWVEEQCASGQPLSYREYPGADHLTVTTAMVPDLVGWTIERLAGKPAPSTCRSR